MTVALEFLHLFERVRLGNDLKARAEVRFVLDGEEVSLDLVRCELGVPTVWTVELRRNPSDAAPALSEAETQSAFEPRTIEGAE